MKRIKYFAVLMFPLCLMVSCALMPGVQISHIEYSVTDKANGGHPVSVDIVAVKGDALVARLEGYSSEKWFTEKDRLLAKNPKELTVWPLTVRPGTAVTHKNIPLYGKPADKVLLFARYSSKGAHRLELERASLITLEFRDSDVYAIY
ncbi:Uncharacterised protein [Leminorella richardii]|uniref:Uncharacterized protein n=1 Tax=Leminorella richardii TaxID=158841 RepID=A0A2X4UQ22_9GAMM|nr:hypothetical protein [Leminorella richardii]SQI40599.1 Uncharacterised protein [Leminorella richardii]